MKKRFLLILFILVLTAFPLLAQSCGASSCGDEIAGCFGCCILFVSFFACAASFALSIWATIWLTKDANNRGIENAGLFTILMILGIIFQFWWIVWLVYIIVRPKAYTKN
ncbi:hypothetical protein KAH81_07290 [bacterium]|nr:hypothetical protein [bacterium]